VKSRIRIFRFYLLAAAVCLGATTFHAASGAACTTFTIKTEDDLVFGRNLDWKTGLGLVIVNKRNVEKTSLVDPPEKPITWFSKYGSVTFNQVGKEYPYGGINEAGLVVEQMSLPQTFYQPPDDRPVVCEVQWIQFQLDNYATVREVIESDSVVRIGQAATRLHFLVADGSGDAAAVEFIGGRMVVHTGVDFPVTALANSTYDDCMIHMRRNDGVPEDMPNFSVYRFARAARMIADYQKKPAGPVVDYAFGVLEAVGHETTRWSIVYDIKNLRVYFKTDDYPSVKIINVRSFDYGCDTPAQMIDIKIKKGGVIDKKFVDYDPAVNLGIVRETFEVFRRDGFLVEVTDSDIREYTGSLDAYECK
jgi:choloylglycine hydrolase